MFGRNRKLRNLTKNIANDLKIYAISICGDQDLAEELTQETLAKILESPHAPNTAGDLKPYGFRMLRNLHIDYLRNRKVRLEYSVVHERLGSEANSQTFDAVDQLIVRQAFNALGEEQREVLFLVDVMGFKYAEVGETMNIPIGTVMSRVSRARAEMLKNLAERPITHLNDYRMKKN